MTTWVNIWPAQTEWMLKIGLCAVPMAVGCFLAEGVAIGRRMPSAGRLWGRLGTLFATAAGAAILAGLLIWAIA